MKPPARNYNVLFAIFTLIIGAIIFAATISGQTSLWLASLPQTNLGLFLRPTEEQILTIHLQNEVTDITLDKPGNYRIISESPEIRARNLAVNTADTHEEIPVTILNQTALAPYNTNLLKGRALLDLHIEEAGSYQIRVNYLDLAKVQPVITLFPEYQTQNKQRLIGAGVLLIIILTVVWVKKYRPTIVEKAVKEEKRDKWGAFMDENQEES